MVVSRDSFAASENMPQGCGGFDREHKKDLLHPTALGSWHGKNIVGGSVDEADLASFHSPKILLCEIVMRQVFPVSPQYLFGLCNCHFAFCFLLLLSLSHNQLSPLG